MTFRRSVRIRGLVQGVGFRPYVHRLASQFGLSGFVANHADHVLIEVEGSFESLARFQQALCERLPPLARVDEVHWEEREPQQDSAFLITPSQPGTEKLVHIGADVATCSDCLAELFDLQDRRYRYAFLNCTNCGPRFTIVKGLPYDRGLTTMAPFPMCLACRREYEDPANRRFHAEPIACPTCGPRLTIVDAAGCAPRNVDPLALAVDALKRGQIVAVKGLGGYHLACLATDEQAVSELRLRKHRDEKPFAIMVERLKAAEAICQMSDAEASLLTDAKRPIVLLRRSTHAGSRPQVAESVAPGNPLLGVMLPYAPLHHLLMADMGGQPLVMTSGNRSDEPIAFEDPDALERLKGIADWFLTHDRAIHLRCDDSITRWCAGGELLLRRSRGHVPLAQLLPVTCDLPILATGGQLKATFALGRDDHAILSHHVGDLDEYSAFQAYTAAIEHFERLLVIDPQTIVHDLHPDYASTRYAIERCSRGCTSDGGEIRRLRRLGVQHHHAHLASCLADNGVSGPAIGVILDGTGYGSDGAIWGGEFLIGGYQGFTRSAHLRYVPMPGGEQAIHEPWRMAAAYLLDAMGDCSFLRHSVPAKSLDVVRAVVARRLNCPMTSSAGRLFDAVAALAGIRQTVSYEGQAAIELEWMASRAVADKHYSFKLEHEGDADSAKPIIIDVRPLIAEIVRDVQDRVSTAAVARRFHTTLVEIIANVCSLLRARTSLDAVALSGGVFMNALILEESTARLRDEGFVVYRHRRVPPNDGGLSLGQLAVAATAVKVSHAARAD